MWPLAGGLALVWLGALGLQRLAPTPIVWAALDVVAHGSAAGVCAVWLLPRFGLRPVLSAVLAGTLIDLDHAVAAHSLDPARMMSLAARPPSHSLAGAVVLAAIGSAALGWPTGYGVGVGMVAHLLGDAIEPAGVPLLAPFGADAHVRLPVAALAIGMLAAAGLSVWLGRCGTPARARRAPAGGASDEERGLNTPFGGHRRCAASARGGSLSAPGVEGGLTTPFGERSS